VVPGRIGDQPPDQQLGDAALDGQGLVLAQQERCGRELHAVPAHRLEPGTGRTGPGEQGHPRRLGLPAQAHHARHVRAVQVGVDQARAAAPVGQRQGEVDRHGGLPDPAFSARDRDDRHVLRTVRHAPSRAQGKLKIC